MPKVSVLIPVYKVEKYIGRCARSLFEQTLDDVEYIFVNDCTPDGSMELLQKVMEEYPTRKDSVRIINHERNQGLATVRNTGLIAARGEYVICCDSDDWVEPDMYEAMYRAAKAADADVVGTDFYNEYSRRTVVQKQYFPEDNVECVKRMLSGNLHCGTWNKLVKRAVFLRNDIRFPDGINMWEDVLTMILVCFHASKIVYLPRAFYHYVRDNGASYTNGMKESSLQNLIEAIGRIECFLKENDLSSLASELCYMKLTVKLNLLLNSSGEQQRVWNKLYPEASSAIWSYRAMSLYWRIALKLSSLNGLRAFNVMSYVRRKVF